MAYEVYVTILDHIGNTPLLKLSKVIENPDVEIYVKCEYMNPSGSTKDRMALRMVEAAEQRGDLKPGGTIIEQSTGNTGPALAFVGAVKSYDVHLYMPAQLSSAYNPADRIRTARLFGCRVTEVDLDEHLAHIETMNPVERAAAFVAIRMKQCWDLQENDPAAWWSNQLCNMNNAYAHRDGTGAEILAGLDGRVDAWVASVGSGGTLLGVAETLKAANPSLTVAGVVPDDDLRLEWIRSGVMHRVLARFGMPKLRFIIEEILEQEVLDHELVVSNADAKNMADRLCREEGLFCGMSSGANVFAAVQMAKELPKGARVATVLVDRRDRYFAEYPHEHYVV